MSELEYNKHLYQNELLNLQHIPHRIRTKERQLSQINAKAAANRYTGIRHCFRSE